MSRPRQCRRIRFRPQAHYFKPQGIPLRALELIDLSLEEAEAIRLKYVLGLDQVTAAQRMETSQSTFQRILSAPLEKLPEL